MKIFYVQHAEKKIGDVNCNSIQFETRYRNVCNYISRVMCENKLLNACDRKSPIDWNFGETKRLRIMAQPIFKNFEF